MTKSELSVFLFGLYYIISLGLPLLLIPHFALGLFGLSAGDDVWVRLLGLLLIISGAYYVAAVRGGLKAFFPWTVPSRFATAFLQTVMVAMGITAPALLLFAVVDASSAMLTAAALRADAREEAA